MSFVVVRGYGQDEGEQTEVSMVTKARVAGGRSAEKLSTVKEWEIEAILPK